MQKGKVVAVSLSKEHGLTKSNCDKITLHKGLGVEGDAHYGATVKHRSRVKKNPNAPNLRQVHLIHQELLDELISKGFDVTPGQMAENITTVGIPLLDLPVNSILKIGESVQIRITGLRNPCTQLNGIQDGLMDALVIKHKDGSMIRKAGVMGIVLHSGSVSPDDVVLVLLPFPPYQSLQPV